MTADDLPLMRRWLEPHVQEWWGEPEAELGYIRDMIEGLDTTRPFIFSIDGEPVGYIQYWFIGHHQNADMDRGSSLARRIARRRDRRRSVDRRPDRLAQGIGSGALRAFVDRLIRQGHQTIIIDPDPENVRAVRAYEKAGFRAIPQLVGRTGDALIMQ